MSKNKKNREMENCKNNAEENKQYQMQEKEKELNNYSNKTSNDKDCD